MLKKVPKKVLVCQNVTCKKQGAAEVLEAFQSQAPEGIAVEPSGCLGHCGNGPMVLTEPDNFWYHRVGVEDVGAIALQHLGHNCAVRTKLYPVAHDKSNAVWIWVIGVSLFLCLCGLLALVVGGQFRYS